MYEIWQHTTYDNHPGQDKLQFDTFRFLEKLSNSGQSRFQIRYQVALHLSDRKIVEWNNLRLSYRDQYEFNEI